MKYFVRRKNMRTNAIAYKSTKCLDTWKYNNPEGCWQYSKQGAQGIAERYNKTMNGGGLFVYDIVPAQL